MNDDDSPSHSPQVLRNNADNFKELTVGYHVGDKWFPMDKPIRCSYKVKLVKFFSSPGAGGETVYPEGNSGDDLDPDLDPDLDLDPDPDLDLDPSFSCHSSLFAEAKGGDPASIQLARVTVTDERGNTSSQIPCNGGAALALPVESRGVTIRQLRAVWANVQRRCTDEKWTNRQGVLLKPEQVNLYDVNKYVIKPFTNTSQRSFVESLPSTSGPQPPRWFISHWWGEPVKDFLSCLEQHTRDFLWNKDDVQDAGGGGMTIDTPYWVCAYANNQWHLTDDITRDPSKSGFTKALIAANGRTVSILDKEGTVFTRVWCVYELYLALLVERKLGFPRVWAAYTAHKHLSKVGSGYNDEALEAVGIVHGVRGAPCDLNSRVTALREAYFPMGLVFQSLDIKVETATASIEDDRRHILNSIVGKAEKDLDDAPESMHEKYDSLNNLIHSTFATSQGALQAARREGSGTWQNVLIAMSKATDIEKISFDFGYGWDNILAAEAMELISHLPTALQRLHLAEANFGPHFVHALADWIDKANDLEIILISSSCINGDDDDSNSNTISNSNPNPNLARERILKPRLFTMLASLVLAPVRNRASRVARRRLAKAVASKDSIKKVKVCDTDYFLGSEKRILGKNVVFEPLQWVGDDSC